MSKLTDLEALILGILNQRGPITTYAVSKVFADSLTSRWSGSAGAIYPAMKRLEARGLVEFRQGQQGRRQHKSVALTTGGRKALRAWVRPPFSDGVGGPSEDPLRSRVFSLDLLTPALRQEFLVHSIALVQEELERADEVLEELEAAGDELGVLGLEGVRFELRARLEWLRMVKRRIGRLVK